MSTCSFCWTTAQVDLGNGCPRVFFKDPLSIFFQKGPFLRTMSRLFTSLFIQFMCTLKVFDIVLYIKYFKFLTQIDIMNGRHAKTRYSRILCM